MTPASRRRFIAQPPASPPRWALPAPAALSGMLLFLLATLAPSPAATQTLYVAFGDSITFGIGDEGGGGYPARLPDELAERGEQAEVLNAGVPGETTAEGVSRIEDALADPAAAGADVLLLMEGTNDVGARISPETVRFNLEQISRQAAARGVDTVHLTVVPRLPSANFDGSNRVTGRLAAQVRELAWSQGQGLADPFEVFLFQSPDPFGTLYVGGTDKLHPNPAGYDLMAEVVADALTGRDRVPPVPGPVTPRDGSRGVDPAAEVRAQVFDFGEGLDLPFTELLVNGEQVETTVQGDERRAELVFRPAEPLRGVVEVRVRSRDLASPPAALDRRVSEFMVAGTELLAGDIDQDGRVDGEDLVIFAVRFGTRRGEGAYRAFADLNGDDAVDGEDLAVLASNFGQSSF